MCILIVVNVAICMLHLKNWSNIFRPMFDFGGNVMVPQDHEYAININPVLIFHAYPCMESFSDQNQRMALNVLSKF